MPRTTAHRTAALAVSVTSSLLLGVWAAAPAAAHGAPTDPASRVYGCSPDGSQNGTAACRAAVAANGSPFTAWDNLRVANVNGRDRQTIPDGELCSGGLPAYRGLDLARTDWPSTRMTPGAALTMRYVSTIPHTGTFRLYLTKPGYDPAKPLTWSDLPEKPFAEVKDPALTDGAYRIDATLPSDRTGRQVLYTVWQNSSTPDTYYSCSDVVFPAAKSTGAGAQGADPAAGGGSGSGSGSGSGEAKAGASPGQTGQRAESAKESPAPAGSAATAIPSGSPAEAGAAPESTPVASAADTDSDPSAPTMAGGAAAVLLLIGGAAAALRLRRR
ncbi:putative carbohydrate-binding protein with CBM5 and CBM33 domain [Streptomyces sp. LBL]|uniref:lytic polysaccharide monooxygenase n=1 Tax=Streptomyces sp. LBL TaxID=2940562 RepID=UPI0024731195|nr:lytic polysaccharide monooxygenase [Streptomyces sp. LBL]MDH6625588.1 putative carbohydrate-binding protein with CBM5 and CBM33 domain [Streptomyces sp. LBL]